MSTANIQSRPLEVERPDPHSVAGRTIVVTGGASGIGAEIAADLVGAGATRGDRRPH